jgi:hypothetical protein
MLNDETFTAILHENRTACIAVQRQGSNLYTNYYHGCHNESNRIESPCDRLLAFLARRKDSKENRKKMHRSLQEFDAEAEGPPNASRAEVSGTSSGIRKMCVTLVSSEHRFRTDTDALRSVNYRERYKASIKANNYCCINYS